MLPRPVNLFWWTNQHLVEGEKQKHGRKYRTHTRNLADAFSWSVNMSKKRVLAELKVLPYCDQSSVKSKLQTSAPRLALIAIVGPTCSFPFHNFTQGRQSRQYAHVNGDGRGSEQDPMLTCEAGQPSCTGQWPWANVTQQIQVLRFL